MPSDQDDQISEHMKTQLKIILLPTLIMTCIFAISMIVIEFHQKNLLQERMSHELKALSSFSLSAVEMVSYGFTPEELDSSFDLLADQIAQASHYRISYFYINGMMLGDSKLDFDQVLLADNHSDRPEIKNAILHEYGLSKRYSKTLQQNMVYLAKYDPSTNFIARVSLPAALSGRHAGDYRLHLSADQPAGKDAAAFRPVEPGWPGPLFRL